MKINGIYNSAWDGGYVISTPCTIDLDTGIVDPETASDEESAEVDVLDREYVELDGKEFDVKFDEDNQCRVVDLPGLVDLVSRAASPMPV